MLVVIDGRIARVACTASVAAGDQPSAAYADGVLRTELPAALSAALDRALVGDPTVYVARSLHCEVQAGPTATGEVLARSIAAQVLSAVRDPDRDGPGLVRFASTADYLAAFLAALVRGDAWRRWYFDPLRRLARPEPAAVLLALDAEGRDLAPVLLALRRSGELGRVLAAVGEEALGQLWPSARPARPRQAEWLSLVRLALDLARVLGWDTSDHPDLQAVAAGLAGRAGADLDWADPVALAHALAAAVPLISARPAQAGGPSADQLPAWLDWADADTLVQGLSARPRPARPPDPPPGAPAAVARPPRTLAVEAALSRLVASGAAVLDHRYPATGSVVLWAALVEQMPEVAEATWARAAVGRFVTQRLAAAAQAVPGGTEVQAWQLPVTGIPCAGVYLLLRTLDALRMPELCRQAGVPPGWLLLALARRWAGPEVTPDEVADTLHPVAGVVRPVAAYTSPGPGSLPADTCTALQAEVARTAAAQGGPDPSLPVSPASLTALTHAHDGDPEIDLPLDLVALTVLGHWARWLRGFDTASVPFILSAFVRRPGRLTDVGDGTLHVVLDRLPHDAVLEVSGCLAPFEPRWPWTDQAAAQVRRIEFAVEA
jgi:hypothetical protein